jgi:hypothetical protein
VAEAGASRKPVGTWELFDGTYIEWGTRWWTRFGAVLGRLSVGRPCVCKWPFMARRYGRCCMYGPNYVKLSRVFAVQLFSMIIEHYAALPPVRSDPHWSHSHAIIASIRLALTHTLQHTLLATQTSTVATTTCLGYLHSHT